MTKFKLPFFKSASQETENEYSLGVLALQGGNYAEASERFQKAAQSGHVSALYNLSILWGGGHVTPYDFDLAADCWYKAAAEDHPTASQSLWQLEAADRGGFGTDNLVRFALQNDGNALVAGTMICAARFFDVICRKFGATADVIAYELDAARMSDYPYIQAFVRRTGLTEDFYLGGLDRLVEGSAANQVTDGLNNLHLAMRQSGMSEELALMARCSIVGHVIRKSPYGDKALPLRGVDTFFQA